LNDIGSNFAGLHPENFSVKTTILTFLILVLTLSAYAQPEAKAPQPLFIKGKISGRILDSASRQPIGFATVAIKRVDDKKIINGAFANEKGFFSIDSVPNGAYTATFDFIGYKRLVKKDIVISDKNKKVVLGDILLPASGNQLGTVNITRQKDVIENKADRIVFNVDKDVTSQGGVATDVLKKVPQVSVDVDGNVEVQGNGNVLFLINGKPSTIFGNNITDVLQTIPASEIERIEVITSPGAKYDAEGTGGIINIVLKKAKVQGINGNVTGSLGTRLENGSFNLNARKGNFGGHAWFSANTALLSTTLSSLNSITKKTGDTTNTLIQNGQSGYIRGGYQGGLGFNWDINPKNSLSLSIGYNEFSHNGSGSTIQQSFIQDNSGKVIQNTSGVLNSTNNFGATTLDYSLFYKKQFDQDKQQLSFLYTSSNSVNNSYYSQTQNSANNDTVHSGSRGINPGTDLETNISADYTQPVGASITLQTGVKAVLSNITSGTNVYVLDTMDDDYALNSFQSNALTYNRNIYAGYLSGSFMLWNSINTKAGLRYERTVTNADFGTGETVQIPDYSTLAPSLVLSKDIGNGQSIKLAYNHRIQRPSYRVLNPFINAADPRNISTGNPDLQPEVGDKIEAGYNKSFNKGGNLNIGLFYQTSNHDIQSYITYLPIYQPSMRVGDTTYTNVNLTRYANVGLEERTGLSLSGSVPFTSKFNVRGNMMVFDNYIINEIDPGQNSNGIDYRINFNASYQLDSTLVAEAYGNFNSSRSNIQGKTGSWSTYSIAIRKLIWHKKGSIGLTTTDPFNEYVVMTSTLSGPNFSIINTRKVPYRSFGISFAYKFGKLEFKKNNNGEENNEDQEGD